MRRLCITIAYDGTLYCGWQVQKNGVSIQTLVQQALETILRHPIQLTGAGRTDAGVHAKGQTAHFDTESPLPLSRLRLSANALLPPDIRILEVEEVASDFHARYSAKGKVYHYHLQLTREGDPTTRLYRAPIFGSFNRQALETALPYFLGTHDFAAFANAAHTGIASYDSVRTLSRLDCISEQGGLRLEFEGDGFLYKMVRNIVGTLVDIAKEKKRPEDILHLLSNRDRKQCGSTAPPEGLFLIKVLY